MARDIGSARSASVRANQTKFEIPTTLECERISSSPPHRGGIFVEVEFSGSAPQRGAIFVGANVSMIQHIGAQVVGNWLLQIWHPAGVRILASPFLQICHPAGVERMNFFTPSSVVGSFNFYRRAIRHAYGF